MNNYKVNIKYGTSDLNNILIKVLNSELKKHIIMICKNQKCELSSSYTYLSTKDKEDRSGR